MKLFLLIFLVTYVAGTKLQEKFAWKTLEFNWPSESYKNDAIKTGRYVPGNNLPLGLEIWRNKLFITIPRWKGGVAASLAYVDLSAVQNNKSPVLNPYPNWESHQLPIEVDASSATEKTAAGRTNAAKPAEHTEDLKDNNTIISPYRVTADQCNRLWVMDTGLADVLGKPNAIATPSILIYDLQSDTLIHRYFVPKSQLKEDTFFANIILDEDINSCENTYAYIPDLGGYGIVVYSYKNNKSWRIKHNFFHFDPLMGDFNIGGVNFQWTDGVFGMAVGKLKKDGTKDVYFHALASSKEFVVSNRVLQNETHVTGPNYYYDFELLGDRGPMGQSSSEVYDKETDTVFYTQLNKDALACWNVNKKPYNPDTQGLVDSDSVALEFPNDIKVDQNGYLWLLSDRMPAFIYKGGLEENEINYRIMIGRTADIIRGTPCDLTHQSNVQLRREAV